MSTAYPYDLSRHLPEFRRQIEQAFADAPDRLGAFLDYGCSVCPWRTTGTGVDEIVGAYTTHAWTAHRWTWGDR